VEREVNNPARTRFLGRVINGLSEAELRDMTAELTQQLSDEEFAELVQRPGD
jgi:hypothetical protein